MILRTTAYKPVANGQIERVHKTINAIFAKIVSQNLQDWCELAPFVTFAYNTSRHSSTSFSPFYFLYLREPRVGIDLLLHKKEPAYQNFDQYSDDVRRKMQIAYKIVENQLKVVFDRAKRRYDARVRSVKFDVGDLCYFHSPRLFAGRGRKFRNQTSGPWKVIRKVNEVNNSIQKSPKSKARIVHVERMMKYFGEVPKNWQESEPKTVNLVCCENSTRKTDFTESENWHDTPVTSSAGRLLSPSHTRTRQSARDSKCMPGRCHFYQVKQRYRFSILFYECEKQVGQFASMWCLLF